MQAPRVLVADDDPEIRALVAQSLAADGMSVRVAGTGSELLSKLAEGRIDLLVTDVMMPELGGVQAAAMARTAGVEVPILVMTAHRAPWIGESVRRLQRADVLYKPFSNDELVRRVHALLTPERPRPVDASSEKDEPHLFPPALVPLLRNSVGDRGCIAGISDEVLTTLLSVVFFAGLEREEGERHQVRVVFVGAGPVELEAPVDGVPSPLFRWSTLRFRAPRGFSTNELVKLAAATTNGRVFVQVSLEEGRLVITGLAREGVNLEGDRALKIVVQKPGGLSIRVGRHHALDYEHGHVQSLASDVILTGGPVRRALERAASACGLPSSARGRYLDAVRLLVAKLSAHGSGGILAFSADQAPEPAGETGYRTYPDISLASMLLHLHRAQSQAEHARHRNHDQDQLLVGALQSELQHTIGELGALTALDGATILDRSLSLVGFGVVLPVGGALAPVLEAQDVEAVTVQPFDLGGRGTRHRAAATHAWNHPGCVVFVASQDGNLGCLFRSPGSANVILWRLGPADRRRS